MLRCSFEDVHVLVDVPLPTPLSISFTGRSSITINFKNMSANGEVETCFSLQEPVQNRDNILRNVRNLQIGAKTSGEKG